MRLRLFFIITASFFILTAFACRTRNADIVTIALDVPFSSLNTLTTTGNDAASERIRQLVFNSLVKKNEKFEYVGDLASDVKISEDGTVFTFILRDNVKFHSGKVLDSADVKYTLDTMLASGGTKRSSFFENNEPFITSVETPDAKTVVLKLRSAAVRWKVMSSLVTIGIIPKDTVVDTLAENPIGTGFFKFVKFDKSQNIVELSANDNYFDGAPAIKSLRVKTVADANSLQAELKAQKVDLVPLPTNLSTDTLNALGQDPNLKVEKLKGSNVRYIGFNVKNPPFDNVKVRQAVAFAINREKIINELLGGQAQIAHSILPEDSWAFNSGTKYTFDPAKAKQLLDEAGFKADAGGKRNLPKIYFKIPAGSVAIAQYSQVIQNQLKEVGIIVDIDTAEANTVKEQLILGQFQITTSQWVGGNQDPIFLKDLFHTDASEKPVFNRARYSNKDLDPILNQAVAEIDREKAKTFYAKAQEIISNDVPLIPLWYPSNIVVANKRIGNIKLEGSGDWSFVRNLTVNQQF